MNPLSSPLDLLAPDDLQDNLQDAIHQDAIHQDVIQQPLAGEQSADPLIWGTVLAVQANYYQVKLDLDPTHPCPQLLCTRRARLKKIGQLVMVGDRVGIDAPDWQGQRGAIAAVQPRQTCLTRPAVANANQLLLVFALADPDPDPYQLSRFLVTATATGLEVCLGLSKSDLVEKATQQAWQNRLQAWGYRAFPFSIYEQTGLELLQAQLQSKITVVSGPSGVGKSSLINTLIPQSDLRVGAISQHWGKGQHTTRHVELFALPQGGLLADTPGFNQPALIGTAEQLAQAFPEIGQRLQGQQGQPGQACQFSNCLHRDEPNCVVRGDWERYSHYLEFLAELQALAAAQTALGDAESSLKQKSRHQGQTGNEPKLDFKRYRRSSRRSQQQLLQRLYDEDTESLST
jgi:ribosome biogenesis GTPase